MGTRGLYCVVMDDAFKVAQYGQWDAYPNGQGAKMLAFVRKLVKGKTTEDKFRAKLTKLAQMTDEEVSALWKQAGADENGMIGWEAAKKFGEVHPEISRDTCAGIMDLVLSGQAKSVKLEPEFAADSLFCEWAYVIDMDNRNLEVYQGFQKKSHRKGRFSKMVNSDNEGRTTEYFPVARIAMFPFDALPTDEDFLTICEHPRSKKAQALKLLLKLASAK